eukprot:NODE_1351_length_950_cov_290.854606_g1041_i0.p1 GENE.NODE_1351_length_950_cov_290.854606_g1041_i0~~NODE_1351_length_950_cov_290.854606_g1041_i0.p1  ORF type:complete len:259 (+),score=69.73 NODE_1351_length_950_cov_290.854606_g1041_i0:60-779(+)
MGVSRGLQQHSNTTSGEEEAQAKINRQAMECLLDNIVAGCQSHGVAGKDVPHTVFQLLTQEFLTHGVPMDLSVYSPTTDPDGYRKFVVANRSGEGYHPHFSLTLIVLAQGQRTPAHDHKVDCAPIALQGKVLETMYEVATQTRRDAWVLSETEKRVYDSQQFEGGYLYQTRPNLHALSNGGEGIAMSLHLYVFDAEEVDPNTGKLSSSVKTVYSPFHLAGCGCQEKLPEQPAQAATASC